VSTTQRITILVSAGFALLLLAPHRAVAQLTWVTDARHIHYDEDWVPRFGGTSQHFEHDVYGPGDFSHWVVDTTQDSQLLPFDGTSYHFIASGVKIGDTQTGNSLIKYTYGFSRLDETFTTTVAVNYIIKPSGSSQAAFNRDGGMLFSPNAPASTTIYFSNPLATYSGTLPPGTWQLTAAASAPRGLSYRFFNFDFAVTAPEPAALALAPLAALFLRARRRRQF